MIWEEREPMGGDFMFYIVKDLFQQLFTSTKLILDFLYWGLILFLDNIISISFIGLAFFLFYRIFVLPMEQSWNEIEDRHSTLIQEEPEETLDEDPLGFWKSMTEEKGIQEWNATQSMKERQNKPDDIFTYRLSRAYYVKRRKQLLSRKKRKN